MEKVIVRKQRSQDRGQKTTLRVLTRGEVRGQRSEVRYLPSAVCHLSSVICHLFSVLCLLLTVACFSGCGYTASSILPKSIKTIHVETFKNRVDYTTGTERNLYLPLLEVDARNAVIDRFLLDGNLEIAEPHEADLILKGELKNYQRSGLRFTDADDVEEYRVHITVSFELWNTKIEEISWSEPNFVGEATYFVTGPSATTEKSAVEEAIVDLARRIVERTIEDW